MREIDEKKSDESDKGRDLLDAVVKNQFDCAEALLISGAPLDSKDSTSIYQTPLDWAVLHKNPKMIKLLMEHKAIPISPVIQPIVKAAEAPTMPRKTGSFTPSNDKTVIIIWTSFLKSLGKSGLNDLSIALPERTAFSDGLVSFLINRWPVILPPA